MSRVDEGWSAGPKMFVGRMMAQVTGEVDVGVAGCCGIQQGISGSGAQRDGVDRLVRVASSPHSPDGTGESFGDSPGEGPQCHRFVEMADTTDTRGGGAGASSRVNGRHVVGGHLVGMGGDESRSHCGACPGRGDDVNARFLNGLHFMGCADGGMGAIERSELAAPDGLETTLVVTVEPPGPGIEEGIAKRLRGAEGHLGSPQIHGLGDGFEGTLDDDAQEPREDVIDTTDRSVGIGVGTHEGNAMTDELVNDASLGGVSCHRADPTHEKWVVDDEHVRVRRDRGVDDVVGGFQSAHDVTDGVVRVTAHQTRGIPRLRQGWRVPLIEDVANPTDGDEVVGG